MTAHAGGGISIENFQYKVPPLSTQILNDLNKFSHYIFKLAHFCVVTIQVHFSLELETFKVAKDGFCWFISWHDLAM